MDIFAYFLALVIIFSSFRVVSGRNAVHSVLYLVLTVFSVSVLLLVSGVEVLALMLLVVYVGAVAILFLFVVMMLRSAEFKIGIGFSVTKCTALLSLALYLVFWLVGSYEPSALERTYVDIKDLGAVLYTDYVYLFHLSGVVLLFAMIAAVSVTLPKRKDVKRQVIGKQIARSSEVQLVDVSSRAGVDY